MEEAPSLKLVFLQGPRQGESLLYPPASSIRIGRIARGNNLPVKDSGVSSKHLSITSDSGKWVLVDLDSSNGTVLDSTKVTPLVPFDLHNDSIIKIGELTSIRVTLIPHQQDTRFGDDNDENCVAPPVEVEPVVKRQRGRAVKGKGLNAIGDNESGLVGQPDNKPVTRNAKRKKQSVIEIPDSVGNDDVEEPKKMTRAKQKSKKEEAVIGNVDAVDEKVEKPKTMTRGKQKSKKEEGLIGNLDAVDEKVEKPKMMTRGKQKSKKEEGLIGNLDAVDEKVAKPKNIRVTRNMKNKGIVIGENVQNSNLEECRVKKVEGKKKRGVRCTKKKNEQEESVKVAELEQSKVDDKVELNHHSADEKKSEDCSAQEENLGGNCNWPDLEKMSLGDWFDFLEVQLPKQIIGSTEEIIDSMRHKAERLRDYITEQNNDKGKMPV